MPRNLQTTFVAKVGDTAILHCPIEPGALIQFYSVRWKRNSSYIAELPQKNSPTDPRYHIDSSTFSLTINSVNVNDSSEGYQCEVHAKNAQGTQWQLVPSREVSLSLYVLSMLRKLRLFCLISV